MKTTEDSNMIMHALLNLALACKLRVSLEHNYKFRQHISLYNLYNKNSLISIRTQNYADKFDRIMRLLCDESGAFMRLLCD